MWFEVFRSLVLGAIQGLTEFFPVSSSGHLILVPVLFHWPDQGLAFDAMLNLGTVTALIIFFRNDLLDLFRRLISKGDEQKKAGVFVLKIIVATIPAALLGVLLSDLLSAYSRQAWLVAFDTALWALVLLWADRWSGKQKVTLKDYEQVSWKQALTVGFAQPLALAPGTSRSGITISAGLFTGLSRDAAARFSFFLSIPITGAAGLFGLFKVAKQGVGPDGTLALVVGFLSALCFGIIAIRFLLSYVAKHRYDGFVAYRLALALLIAVLV
jgi:undecaprenyl-diphosphatase